MSPTVCFLVQNVYDSDPRVRRKAEALVAAGYSVDVLALRPLDGAKTYVLNGVTIHTIALGKKRASLPRYLFEYSAFFVWALVRVALLMRVRRYAVIDVNTLPDFLVFAPMVAAWMGAKIVLDMHEITPEFYVSKYGIAGDSRLVRLLTCLERVSFDFADHVITINHPVQDLLVSRGLARSKSTVMMNAVDERRFTRCADSSAVGQRDASTRFVMLYHGTLTRIYGLDIAIEAFALAHRDMPGAELWILGSGPDAGALADLARERGIASKVRMVGQVAPETVPQWLARCDVGILPLRRDVFLDHAFPNKLPEFIIMGKPVAMTRLKAIRYYFGEEALAYFEPHNPRDLADRLRELYGNPERRALLASNAARDYAPIRWDLMKNRYVRLVGALAGLGLAAEQPQTADSTALAG